MPDPHLEIKGGGGGGLPQLKFFPPFGPQFSLQIRRDSPGPSPGSATEVDVICSIPHILLHFLNIQAREDKGDREGIPHTHPIPQVIRLEFFFNITDLKGD